MGKQLLRRPRAPKQLPPMPDSPDPSTHGGTTKLNDYYESIDFGLDDDFRSRATTRHSPTPSVVPSLVSPPPSESLHRKSAFRTMTFPTPHSRISFVSRDEKKFILDPLYRDHTSLGTYVDGKSLIKPYKPRGPDGLPARLPKKYPEITHAIDIVDDVRFYQPPAFTLESFTAKLADVRGLPLRSVRSIVYSRENYKKLTKIIAEEAIYSSNQEIHLHHLTPEGKL